MASGSATVKSVLSGDTIILVGKATNGPPPEITITLSHVQCPKIARGQSQVDEPFAWDSREYLRALCVGKSVTFKVTQTVSSINRTFGDVFLDGVPLVKMVVAQGWVSLKQHRDASSDDDSADIYAELVELHAAAKSNHLGIYRTDEVAKKAAVRSVDWSMDATKYFESLQTGHQTISASTPVVIDVVIEHIRDGASFRCYVPRDSCYVSFAFAGATCPRVNTPSATAPAAEGSTPPGPEPFAVQSKLFTELRLLNRRLDLAVRGVTSGRGEAMLLGSVLHPRGDITQEIVRAGLAKVADWTLALLPKAGVVALRQAEQQAKHQHRGVWATFVPPAAPACCRSFEATVIEVVSGDTLMVLENGTQSERRITFSSIRVPRQGARGVSSDPFAVECKEFVRSRLIGKTVGVSVEYQRGGEGGKDTRQFGSVSYVAGGQGKGKKAGRVDMALLLVQEGLAVTIRHRGDEPRAAAYDMLLVEEVEAVQKKKGMHGPQSKSSAAAAAPTNDITTDSKKAKAFFATLSKDKTYKAVVEHVFTASRFKVSIASENVTLQLALSQVRTPVISKAASGAPPPPKASSEEVEQKEETAQRDTESTTQQSSGAEEGLEDGEVLEHPLVKWVEAGKRFSRHTLLQRKVDVEITDMDRNGIMMGKIFLPTGNNRSVAVAASLVERGLASVDKFAQRRGGGEITALLESQSDAQSEKRGMWVVPDAVPVSKEREDADDEGATELEEPAAGGKSMYRVSLTEIYNGANFAVNFVDQPNESDSSLLRGQMKLAEVEDMMTAFAREALNDSGDSESAVVTAKGSLLAVLHENPSPPEGDEALEPVWLRACVEEKPEDGKVKVFFVDYGHRATVPVKGLRALPLPLKHYAGQAVQCSLSFLRAADVNTEQGVSAARALNSLAWAKSCLIKVHGREKPAAASDKSFSPPPRLEVSLYAVESFSEEHLAHATNVGVKLVRHGFLRISATLARKVRGGSRPNRRGGNKTLPRQVTTNETLHELEVAQELAHQEHLRLWAYGHPGDSDDEDEPPKKDEAAADKK